ncbi:MAG: hypothetical protein RSB99_03455 [Bacilli bacterium]|uniref:hypothetical protein n=1 Tax=Chryseobacterium sp. TaxID=1871047 RepID=UPI002FC64479
MAKEFSKPFYNSKSWKAARRNYIANRIKIDGGMCEVCRKVPGTIVHHVENLTEDNIKNPEISLNHSMLRLDCKSCHDREEGHFVKTKKTKCSFDSNGQPLPPIKK